MKKRIAIFVVLAMVLCLALTGCGQSDKRTEGTGNVVENGRDDGFDFDTGDSSIMDGTNNPGGDSEDYPLGNDESIPDGGAEWEATHGGGGSQNSDGSYTWQVGNYTLTTKINVMDYIDGKVWRVNDMAAALGWDKNAGSNSKKPMTFQMDESYNQYINFSDSSDHCGAIMIYINGDRTPHTLVLPPRSSDDYTFNNKDFTMSFEGIVAFAYACEQISANPTVDPFEGVLGTLGSDYTY